jgi:signal transduction histidine kinase
MKINLQIREKAVFYIIGIYILLQFLWWEMLLTRQNNEILELKKNLVAMQYTDMAKIQNEINKLEDRYKKKLYMIAGEGTIFLIFLISGFYALSESRKKEKKLQQEKELFYSGITHELKTPIASIILQLQTLQKIYFPDAEKSEFISRALSDAQRINFLINNVLYGRQLIYGKVIPQMESFCLYREWEKIKLRYADSTSRLKEEVPENLKTLEIKADREMCRSILSNLLENAMRYSSPSSPILVRWEDFSDFMRLSILNEGEPLPEEVKKNIFKPFIRKSSDLKGTGLGLFVAHTFAKKMGHELIYQFENHRHVFIWNIKKIYPFP